MRTFSSIAFARWWYYIPFTKYFLIFCLNTSSISNDKLSIDDDGNYNTGSTKPPTFEMMCDSLLKYLFYWFDVIREAGSIWPPALKRQHYFFALIRLAFIPRLVPNTSIACPHRLYEILLTKAVPSTKKKTKLCCDKHINHNFSPIFLYGKSGETTLQFASLVDVVCHLIFLRISNKF